MNKFEHASAIEASMKTHPFYRFWSHCYQDFQSSLPEGSAFNLPGFAGPLTSPNFVLGLIAEFLKKNSEIPYFNQILSREAKLQVPRGFQLSKQFLLGTALTQSNASSRLGQGIGLESISLASACERDIFWQLLQEGFGKDVLFLRQFLPFVATLATPFRCAFLKHEQETIGIVNVAIAGQIAFALNAVISPRHRHQGRSQAVVAAVHSLAVQGGAKEIVFWTEHDFLARRGDESHQYLVFTRRPLDGTQ